MNICLIGNGVATDILAIILANRNIKVSIFEEIQKTRKSKTRTLSLSKNNIDFLKKEKINIYKNSWPINKIKIYTEKQINKEILNFGSNKKEIFYIIKYEELLNFLNKIVKKNNLIKKNKIINNSFFKSIIDQKNSYDLIINLSEKNKISKKIFFKRNEKNYDSTAFTTLIDHSKIENNIAVQIFTKLGPLAFLPCSENQTSIVYSKSNKNMDNKNIKELILYFNKKYKIKSFSKFEKFKLKSSLLKNYYYKKILCFGENLHKIHPLAGQGLNMTIRDIKILSDLIDFKISLGLPIDSSILKEFQNKTKHYNYIFSESVDFIHEFFKYDNNFNNKYSTKIFNFLETNGLFKKYTEKFADKGIF